VDALATLHRNLLEEATAEYQRHLHLADSYLGKRGIPLSVAEQFRFGVVSEPLLGHEAMTGRLCIPYVTGAGVATLKFRCIDDHHCKEVGCTKYLALPNSERHLYNVTAFLRAQEVLGIAEGEIDALVLTVCGIPSIGVPGADGWSRTPHYARAIQMIAVPRVLVFPDADEAGKKLKQAILSTVPQATAVRLPDGMDVNDVFLAEGAAGLRSRAGLT
jgi:hypothetical protein